MSTDATGTETTSAVWQSGDQIASVATQSGWTILCVGGSGSFETWARISNTDLLDLLRRASILPSPYAAAIAVVERIKQDHGEPPTWHEDLRASDAWEEYDAALTDILDALREKEGQR